MKKTSFLLIFCIAFILQPVFIMGQPRPGALPTVTGVDSFREDTEPTPEDEYYLGRAVAANILSAYKPYTQSRELTLYLNRILQTLVVNSERPVIFGGYHLMILDSVEYNAFATPGGHIFITRGLVEAAKSEDALAGIIAHELAHIVLRHSMIIIDSMKVENDLSTIAQQSAAVAGGQKVAAFRQSISSTVDLMTKSGYTKPQEFEADNMAIVLLALSGYDPGGLLEVLRVLDTVQRGQRGGFNTTHPTPAERIANVQALRYPANNTRSARVSRFRNK